MPPLIVAFARKEKLKLNREDCLGRLILTPEGAATHPETAIDCSALGSHFGIPSLKEGLAEIAMLSRPDHRRRAENDAGGGRAGE